MRKITKRWDQEKIISGTLMPFFLMGYSVNKACNLAGIPQRTVQDWIEKDDNLRLKINAWRNWATVVARRNVLASILGKDTPLDWINEKADLKASMKWLEQHDEDFKSNKKLSIFTEITYKQLISMGN